MRNEESPGDASGVNYALQEIIRLQSDYNRQSVLLDKMDSRLVGLEKTVSSSMADLSKQVAVIEERTKFLGQGMEQHRQGSQSWGQSVTGWVVTAVLTVLAAVLGAAMTKLIK